MANWTEADLNQHWNTAMQHGWISFFENASRSLDLAVELLLGIASRETNTSNIKGDFRGGIYHGYGIMQVDIGTDPEFCRTWTMDQVKPSIDRGAKILAGKRTYLLQNGVSDLRAIAAAYNTGEGKVLRSIRSGRDPDRTTTGGDYGRDVLARMSIFTKLRSAAQTPATTT